MEIHNPEPAYQYAAIVENIVDADTVDLFVDLGFGVWFKVRVRLYHIDAPERFTEAGKQATAYLTAIMPVGARIIIKTYKKATDKYGRWVADIFVLTAPGEYSNVSQMMVDRGHAVWVNW